MPSTLALFGILIASCLMSVAILGSLRRAAVPGIDRWCAAYALLAVVSSLVLFIDERPAPAAIMVVGFITFVAVALLVQGTRQFFGIRPARRDETAAFIVAYGALVYVTCVAPDVEMRVALVSAVLAYGRVAVGTLVLRHAPRDGARYGYWFVTVAAYLGALVHGARAVGVAIGAMAPVTYLQPTAWSVLFVGLAIITLPCMSIGMAMVAHDQLVRRMEKLATIDELTGALMRRAFMAKANALHARALAAGEPLAVAILDIDNFKAINDGFGHAAGDRTLTHFGAVVARELRACDLFGRLGGEEFGVVFAGTRKPEALRFTNALRLALERAAHDGVRCTFSAGVACIAPGDALEAVMARADAALYAAKAMGRNRVVTAPDAGALSTV
ncbi:diguanylate cyclase (GGDEF)-like protein [Paraburkholderia unamae]|uniref:GGDEF domain-containing protein n=1 Tax=Paraburkholderia unamae TaxID=219649 RepID=UPI000DC20712|nr:GGDEF domain-containing protein [Paraburkholderia unamae]RAR57833.1 diguanylate cyclase (GGDEF)-like protein [Paraburkholderia unamae]